MKSFACLMNNENEKNGSANEDELDGNFSGSKSDGAGSGDDTDKTDEITITDFDLGLIIPSGKRSGVLVKELCKQTANETVVAVSYAEMKRTIRKATRENDKVETTLKFPLKVVKGFHERKAKGLFCTSIFFVFRFYLSYLNVRQMRTLRLPRG